MKRTWGDQLTAPDGNGWATGPTSALTDYVLGLRSTGMGGSSWLFQPHLAGLTFAQGRLGTPTGTLTASWHLDNQSRLRAQISVPRGTPAPSPCR